MSTPTISTPVILTDNEFYNRFKPETENHSYPVQRNHPNDTALIEQATAENRIWTMLDCDGKLVLASGNHRVNQMYYVVTRLPWDQNYEVPDDLEPLEFIPAASGK